MSQTLPFYLVDVFATGPLTGNPLALVPDADHFDPALMRAIAREFNQSETTFLLRPTLPSATHRLRSFTPAGAEVGGAGHNALGAWLWLAASGRLPATGSRFTQEIAGTALPVIITHEPDRPVSVTMDQSPPEFGAIVTDRVALAAALGLTPSDLAPDTKAQVVSTGTAHLLVPARDRATIDRASPDGARLRAVLAAAGGEGCYLYSRDPVGQDPAVAYARFFNPTVGIVEDPATGTAAGPLVALLVDAGEVPNGVSTIVEQGHALGRPSNIEVTVKARQVRISGSGLVVAEGTLRI